MSIVIKWSVKAGLTFIQEVGNVRPDESLEQRHHLEHSPETGDGGGEVHIHCRLLNSSPVPIKAVEATTWAVGT